MTNFAEVQYKATDYYAPERERSIAWDDPEVGIDWPLQDIQLIVSTKDKAAPSLSEAEVFD